MSRDYEDFEVEPIIRGYQLLGDSQFVRFSEQLLGKKRRYRDGLAYIGLCVSGQKICDLLFRVRNNFQPTSNKVILMIGTNDLLKDTSLTDMCNTLTSLINELTNKNVQKIVILTIPPVPRLSRSKSHWDRLCGYNDFIKSLDDGINVITIDTCSLFLTPEERLENNSSYVSSEDSANVSLHHSRSSKTSHSNSKRSRYSDPSNVSDRSSDSEETDNSDENDERESHQPRKAGARNIILSSSKYFRSRSIEREPKSAGKRSPSTPFLLKNYNNLRISIGAKRKVVEIVPEQTDLIAQDRNSPEVKRRSFTSLAVDDHNDTFLAEDSLSEERPRYHIKNDFFEEYFAGNRRPDLIHLNWKGLSMIRYYMIKCITSPLRQRKT